MIAGPSYPSYRQRRSFRKFYYALFVVFTLLVWHSRKLGTRRYDEADSPVERVAIGTPVEKIEVRDNLPRVVNAYRHHMHHHPPQSPIEQTPSPVASPEQEERLPNPVAPRKDAVNAHRFVHEDDSDGQDIDAIDRISESTGDNVDHESKLLHPDDDYDDSLLPDTDSSNFHSDEQIKIGGETPKQGITNVDQLLIADHPSKEMGGQSAEEESHVEEQADESAQLQNPIESLHKQTPWSKHYTFPSWDECQSLKDKADSLPDIVHVPFEESVKDVVLEGWEDEWIAKARYIGPKLEEPKIDFVYNWVNGSQPEFVNSMRPYELNSTLNDEEGTWISSHSTNRYREWNELRYSIRSIEKYAGDFTNRIQILVNAFKIGGEDPSQLSSYGKQRPQWLREDSDKIQVLSQEQFFGPDERKCLPTFDSLTIENQLYNTKSETDRLFALSDDMILGKLHAASDLYSPLFGPTMGFKDNAYNTMKPPTEEDAERFGEKPFLIYTSWLLNRRFGARKRKGQVHFGHSLSRSIAKEAITSFPRPALRSAFQRFRGETGFQIYSWYVMFHYTMERHREALLWSYIMLRSDANDDGYLSWNERRKIARELEEGMSNETPELYRRRLYYRMGDHLEEAGLKPPQVNTEALWTSLDGPMMIKDVDCDAFDTEDCLAPGFSMPSSDATARSPVFSTAAIFDRISRQSPRCGDCLLKLILNRKRAGLGPLLPHAVKKPEQREIVIKAITKYQYTIVKPDAEFYMVTDAEQVEHALLKPYLQQQKKVGQICLNDDVVTTNQKELDHLGRAMSALFEGLLPEPSSFEI